MAGWLAKATQSFKKPAPPEPEPFEIICSCSNDVRGMRESEHQSVRCARCGTSLFVLPRNPYPSPKAIAAPKPKRSKPTKPSKPSKPKPTASSASPAKSKPAPAPSKDTPIEIDDSSD